ncbi:hypothetical protein MJO28_017400 [Puccinia striiformis f. sp. tritici]|nr:hypothetical protein MJO28_017400 [Puccinia striiformis f. sp. tritici]
MPRSILHTSCLALYVIAAIHVATRPTICYGASLAKRAIERETDRILPVLFGVDISDGHNAGLEVAPMEIEHDDPRSSSLALKPDDNLDTISLEAYAALVPELFVCQFGSKGTISELLKYLRYFKFQFLKIQNVLNDLAVQTMLMILFDLTLEKEIHLSVLQEINGYKGLTIPEFGFIPKVSKYLTLWSSGTMDLRHGIEFQKCINNKRGVKNNVCYLYDHQYHQRNPINLTLCLFSSLERYLELAHVVLGSSQYWHNELNHYLMYIINVQTKMWWFGLMGPLLLLMFGIKKINLEDWAKERVNKLAYWTIMFLKTYEIKPKNYDLESGSHEHLVQNLLKDLMKVYVTRYESIKYDMKPIDLNLLVSSFDKKTFPSKDRNKPGREQVRYMQNKQLHLCLLIHPILTSLLMSNSCSLSKIRFSGVEEHNEHNTSLKEAQVKREKDEKKMIAN